MEQLVLDKWKDLIDACKNYYVYSRPTGLTDSEYDELERRAAVEDKFFVRDYVFENFMEGQRAENAWIEKIQKTKVTETSMYQALRNLQVDLGHDLYFDLKYDGSSIAIYLDPTTGKPIRCVTCGNLNLSEAGIDHTKKLFPLLPQQFPKGIVAIQCEALVDLNRFTEGDPDRARQKANGLINSKYKEDEVVSLLTLRAYRYYTDSSEEGQALRLSDYREVLRRFETVRARTDGHIMFAPADVWTLDELSEEFCEADRLQTSTGKFLLDGWVAYTKIGICIGALKFAGAGSKTEELVKTHVLGIQWNNQVVKGKDSWSANVLIDPVTIKGGTIRKPSAGSVGKMIKNKITRGAEVSIILANSTIPMVGECFSEGDGDFQWPVCECGYQMGPSDVYGSLLKCGNPLCSSRLGRMRNYLNSLNNSSEINLDKFLVIDRFKWSTTNVDLGYLLKFVEDDNSDGYKEYLMSFMGTNLQKKNMELVWKASWITLKEKCTPET